MDEAARERDRPCCTRKRQDVACSRTTLCALAHCLALLPVLLPAKSWAQQLAPITVKKTEEIAPFKLTGVDGYVQARYLTDENAASSPGSSTGLRQKTTTMREEIFVMTHSYVYHPTLLTLDVGGGPILDTSSFSSTDTPGTRASEQLYNFTGRATFLRDKPYRGALFYEHLNPTQSVGPAQVMLSQSTRYGGNFSLLSPVTPMPLHIEANRYTNQGRSAEQTIDDRIDQFTVRSERRIGTLGTTNLNYQSLRQESFSGSTGLPIQGSRSNSNLFNADTRLKFGARGEYDFNNFISYQTQNYSVTNTPAITFRNLRFQANLFARHSDALQSFGAYSFNTTQQGDQTTTGNSASAGVNYQMTQNFYGSLSARVDQNRSSQFTSTLSGVNGSATYRRQLPVGLATANYTFAYSMRDQKASGEQVRVLGEHVTLPNATLVRLSSQLVVPGSVVVSNLTRTQIFVEGIDYVLSTLGLDTRIQRLVGGNIIDGQEVLVDYATNVGGTYAIDQLDQGVNLSLAPISYLNVYARYFESEPRLTSGTPTFQLNPSRSMIYGTRADIPLSVLSEEVQIGGYTEHEDRREVIAPFKRTQYEAYAQSTVPFMSASGIRIGTRHTKIDYELQPAQGVDLVGYDARLWSRLPYGIEASADARRERDTGALIPRQSSYATARARWRYRSFLTTFELTRTHEVQGAAERTRTRGQLLLRRNF